MDAKAKRELDLLCEDLASVIQELEDISNRIRNDFEGIGSYRCAECIDETLEQCYFLLKRLQNLDLFSITDQFARLHNIAQE